ncbi:MAG: glutamate--tRNA ligase [Bergeyella sp.]|nr:glutamate--tRNA ligase [Bergeyella sp.]
MEKIRVRFAPSPTGALHIGGIRTALYDYLFAKKNGGDFVLRIEDTDTSRYVEGAEDYILNALEWCGIIPDESPIKGGPYGPYRQSERRQIYDKYTQQILDSGNAYVAFDTPEELETLRKNHENKGEVFSYNYRTRKHLRNSLSLPEKEVKSLIEKKTPYVIRFKVPVDQTIHIRDWVREDFSVNTSMLDDKVLVKNDGMPTYHFAHVVDDHEMKISHVIRGEEWLPSLGLHLLLYEAMGWNPPEFAHLPLILKPEGKGKLSKRDGDRLGFPVFPLTFTDPTTGSVSEGYREKGYYPEAFTNFLVVLGWTPEGKEILSRQEMIEEFDLRKVHKSGARFSKKKALWYNQEYLQQKKDEELLVEFKKIPEVESGGYSDVSLLRIISLMKPRAVFVKDLYVQGSFFFRAPDRYDEKSAKKAWGENSSDLLKDLLSLLPQTSPLCPEKIKTLLHSVVERHKTEPGKIMMPLRLALVGELKGPDVPDIITIIGLERTLERIRHALERIRVH